MQKNDIINLEITSVGGEGNGIGRLPDGFVVFVPFSVTGDILEVRILKIKTGYAYGKIEKIVTPSSDRIASACAVFGKCGGCNFCHISYEAECKIKESIIKDAFQRIGGFSGQVLPILKNDHAYRYRNKAQYPIQKDLNGTAQFGFYRTGSHNVIPHTDCLLQPSVFTSIMEFIISFINNQRISVYNEAEHNGVIRSILLRRGHYTGDLLVTVIARRNIPEFKKLAKSLMENFSDITGVTLNINKERTNAVLDFNAFDIVLNGRGYLKDSMCGIDAHITPKTFYQVNTPMAERLYAVAREFAQPKDKVVFDIYSGIGTIGLSMASEAKFIYGIESVCESVESAQLNAKNNSIKNAEFICTDAKDGLKKLLNRGIKPDVIILDPARKGCEKEILEKIADIGSTVVMVSCNPSTAARDAKILKESGYMIKKIQPVDLFSRTKHIECVILFDKF